MAPSQPRQLLLPPPPQQQQPQPQPRLLDPKIWRACAGASVQIPTLHSRVYYFPQGHLEHASSSPQYLSPLVLSRPVILCRIAAVHFLADPVTDEVFAKLLLHPLNDFTPPASHGLLRAGDNSSDASDDDKVVSFAKILTPSDANNGGGFSVPRFCADSIFPPLNFQADPPVQNLSVTDVHGVVWEFRHIYRGTPRRHLLTTGWSKFVNSKKLVAGDSVVFMRNSKGEMFVGIRRAVRFTSGNGGDCARWCPQIGGVRSREVEDEQQEEGYAGIRGKEGFSRNGKGKLSAKTVAEAAESAAKNMPFEVVYYPRAGWSDFVVKAEVVEEAMTVVWTPGMRVKMAMETEDSSRMTWFQGTVSSASAPDMPWLRSPWRMLQVTWDEPEVLHNAKRVSPWQVEHVSPTPAFHAAFPPTKKYRAAQVSGMLTEREGDPFFPMTGFTDSTMGHLNQTLLSYDTFPAGMQGARHDLFSVSRFSNPLSDNSHLCMGNSFGNNTVPRLETVSTELNIGSSQSDELSPNSHCSLHSFGTEFIGTPNCNSTTLGSGSFQLFGKIIQTKQPVESGVDGAGCMGDDGSKGCNETECIDNPLDHSLTYSNLLNRLDVQCQRASTVEACYL